MAADDVFGTHSYFTIRAPVDGDVTLRLGPTGDGHVAHGNGWDVYLGSSPSPLNTKPSHPNPFGAALSAVLAVARLFAHKLEPPPFEFVCNAFDWREAPAAVDATSPALDDIGKLWFVGAGSVGTATAYFLTLATRSFSAALFDMDEVKIHNLDRSPIFSTEDAEHKLKKVASTESYLRAVGVDDVISEPRALDESPLWRTRQNGTPDVLISAANERNVRSIVEAGFPPIQLYATTGKNWQTTLIRHVPMRDPCSVCLFPTQTIQPQTKCATGEVAEQVKGKEVKVDAALPFLSFAAGLMTAAELTKLQLPQYPYSPNRVCLQTRPEPSLIATAMSFREGCACHTRSTRVHHKMLRNSKYARLSNEEDAGPEGPTIYTSA